MKSKRTMPVEWHENCLKNGMITLQQEKNVLAFQQRRVERMLAECELHAIQISEAKRQGKKEFDRERFLVKRVKKAEGL
jgi:hypothetical protein